MVEQPADLGRGEIRIDDQPGPPRHGFGQPVAAPALAQLGGAPVLPDDGVVDRAPGGALPQNRGLALVGDADRGDRAIGSGGHGFAAGRNHPAPDLFRFVFDPARPGMKLRQLELRRPACPALRVEQHRAGARRPLVDRQDIGRGHCRAPAAVSRRRNILTTLGRQCHWSRPETDYTKLIFSILSASEGVGSLAGRSRTFPYSR
jgi:hypothetical protein